MQIHYQVAIKHIGGKRSIFKKIWEKEYKRDWMGWDGKGEMEKMRQGAKDKWEDAVHLTQWNSFSLSLFVSSSVVLTIPIWLSLILASAESLPLTTYDPLELWTNSSLLVSYSWHNSSSNNNSHLTTFKVDRMTRFVSRWLFLGTLCITGLGWVGNQFIVQFDFFLKSAPLLHCIKPV